jgi:hypothetical protein
LSLQVANSKNMSFKITPKFSAKQIRQMLQERLKNVDDAIFLALKRAGEEFVAHARANGNYKDQTGNLRSSIGYIILLNGRQLTENFEGKNSEGVEFARRTADNLKKNHPRGYVLIGVAGMSYAAAVESKGYDVITSSAQQTAASLTAAMKRIELKQKTI